MIGGEFICFSLKVHRLNEKMSKKKVFNPFYLFISSSIVFFSWCIFLSFNNSLESWITGGLHFSRVIFKKENILEKFIVLEKIFLLEDMIDKYSAKLSYRNPQSSHYLKYTTSKYNLFDYFKWLFNLLFLRLGLRHFYRT